jgi:hypothetical protein
LLEYIAHVMVKIKFSGYAYIKKRFQMFNGIQTIYTRSTKFVLNINHANFLSKENNASFTINDDNDDGNNNNNTSHILRKVLQSDT